MGDFNDGGVDTSAEKRGQARALVEAAIRAKRAGDQNKADLLMDQARHTDPLAVEDVLMELEPNALAPDEHPGDSLPATDEEVARISRQLEPNSDAPSRAGISGRGSGADTE